MVVQDYGVWKATPVRYTFEGRDQDSISPHLSLFYTDNEEGEGRAAINIKSGDRQESRLAYWTVPNFTHPITDKLSALSPGFALLADTPEQGPDGLALDFIRGNLFNRGSGRILPHDVDGPNNDILDELKPLLDRALAAKATVYIFGSAFDNGKGIHNVHQNQGNPARFSRDNGVFQDGALFLGFEDHFEAVFIGFASQAVHTEDGPGDDAGQPIPRTGYRTWANFLAPEAREADKEGAEIADSPVLIAEALVNPEGPDGQPGAAPETVTLHNRSDLNVDLDGWKIRNRAAQEQPLPAGLTLAAGKKLVVEVPKAPLSNKGGTITLLDGKGLKVHGVSYTKEQARARGGTVVWAN
ncbi:hypothetical protein B0T18DRAFT_334794 [Schizothecium vesticola]|uniref:LTD domain-containing protein n=1 Tax=Schizothecium vesticola TaxID=314040 RepID=A0AA40EE79_9PEZI|nr:hypothetical protein B0T18DRAFT_334794 [Schizothecium vesticola]